MSTVSLCDCGRECRTAAVLFTCDVCGSQVREKGPYVPRSGSLDLANRWRLDLCRACVESLIDRAPQARRDELRQQAFGVESGVL
ncbi:MAG: hypothetical protein IPM35_17145 [Myxococcales bacterium]|nr:hypothetical protein [Myxococcales bacterium]